MYTRGKFKQQAFAVLIFVCELLKFLADNCASLVSVPGTVAGPEQISSLSLRLDSKEAVYDASQLSACLNT